jgi:hypothetical protein
MTIIGVLSDTHIRPAGRYRLTPQVFEAFENVDLILHAGDLNTLQVLSDLEALAPALAVHGNNDDWQAMQSLPPTRRIEVEACVIGLTHGDVGLDGTVKPWTGVTGNSQTAANAYSRFEFEDDVSCVIFGHSHRSLIHWHEQDGRRTLMFNPGSPTDKRWGPHHSLGLLRVDGRTISAELLTW